MEPKSKKNSRTDLSTVLSLLRRDIYSGIRLPRERLVENELAKTFSVSRVVVREALSQLQKEDLIIIEPYKGAVVAEISLSHIFESYQIVAMLEGFAALLAAERLTPKDFQILEKNLEQQRSLEAGKVQQWQDINHQFHRTINIKCNNQRLIDLISQHSRFTSYWFIVLSAPGRIPTNIEEHASILKAFSRRDAEEARRLMERHIIGAAEYLVEFMRENVPVGMWREAK